MLYIKKIVKSLPKYLQKRLPRRVSLRIIKSKESRRLNRLYRKKNKPTNVLSFRYDSSYGEILLTPEVIRKEARSAGNSYAYQTAWMIVHGMIDLAGVHHEGSKVIAKKVEALEKKILKKLYGRKGKANRV